MSNIEIEDFPGGCTLKKEESLGVSTLIIDSPEDAVDVCLAVKELIIHAYPQYLEEIV